MAADLFERLAEGRPPAIKKPEVSPAQRLLDWLQRWEKDTIHEREVRNYGPRIFRDPKNAVDAIEALARHGWLTWVPSRQRITKEWRINRKREVYPVAAAE